MDLIEISALFVVSIVFLISLIGCFLPVIPGPALAFFGILGYKLILPESSETWNFIIISGILVAIVQLLDFLCTYWGVKKFGASWQGGLGAIIGVFVGIILPPQIIWIFLAPVLFAAIFELLFANNTVKGALKAGVGAFMGFLLSTVIKVGIVIAIIIAFFSSLNLISISS